MGCKVNQVETESVAQLLRESGFDLSGGEKKPDIIFVNTCCVTGRAEAKSRRFVGSVAKKFPSARVVVAGCLAELKPEDLESLSPNVECVGTFARDNLALFAGSAGQDNQEIFDAKAADCKIFGSLPTPMEQDRSRALLKIQDGCSQRCSYCIVPTTRGPSRSMDQRRALDDIARLDGAGYPEIVLTGIHLGAYGKDLRPATTLTDFVTRAVGLLTQSRLRLSSIEPQEVSKELIDLVESDSRICNHFHIPVQSLDDAILRDMGRPYTKGLVLDLIKLIRTRIPDACIGADIMLGFPGEDEHSFGKTYESLAESELGYLHVFPFSPRPGTSAQHLGRTPDRKTVAQRVIALRDLSARMRHDFHNKFIGRDLEACLESDKEACPEKLMARTDNYIQAEIEGPSFQLTKKLFWIRIDSVGEETVRASLK